MRRIGPYSKDPAELARQLEALESAIQSDLLRLSRGKPWNVRPVLGVTNVDAESGDLIDLDCTSEAKRVYLPAPSPALAGAQILVRRSSSSGSYPLSVYPRTGTISGAAYQSMTTNGAWMLFVCLSDSWEVFA